MPRPSSREKLLDCAENLFATHGVGGVSLRMIQAAAGLSVGSLRYHFKSEAELVTAVMERRVGPLMARHETLLEALAANPSPSTAEILRALIQPLIELLHSQPERGRRYLTLMHRLQVGHHTAPVFIARWPDFAERTEGLLKKSLPHLSDASIAFRVALVWETILGSLAGAASLSEKGLEGHEVELINYLTGALEAPQTNRRRRNSKRRTTQPEDEEQT
jgi:AcrR family transcriptional regulator